MEHSFHMTALHRCDMNWRHERNLDDFHIFQVLFFLSFFFFTRSEIHC